MFKLVGDWEGETIGQDFGGRGRMLVWLAPVTPMSRVEPDEASHYPDSPSMRRKIEESAPRTKENILPIPPRPALPKGE